MSDEELIDYTDPDIIARQNIAPNAGCNIDGKFYDVRNLVHLASSQADRIEELTAKLAENEVRLRKAVEALEDIVKDCEADYPPSHGAIKYFARATLAEISSEAALNKGESRDVPDR